MNNFFKVCNFFLCVCGLEGSRSRMVGWGGGLGWGGGGGVVNNQGGLT